MKRVVARAPKKAAAGTSAAAAGKTPATNIAKNPAPALTPMTFGLAIALLSTAWISAPATARAAPAAAPATVRGSRT